MLKLSTPILLLLLIILTINHRLGAPWFLIVTPLTSQYWHPLIQRSPLNTLFFTDTLSAPILILTLWITALILSVRLYIQTTYVPLIPPTISLLTLTLLNTFPATNLFLFYILFETSLIPTSALILLWGYQPDRHQAAIYILIYTITASLPLLASTLALYKNNHHLNFLFTNWETPQPIGPKLWSATLSLAFIVKVPLYSTHLWLPKAHVEAPTPGSIILASVLLKLGGFGILRLLQSMPLLIDQTTPFLLTLAAWGAALTCLISVRQTDFKALIAYSSVAHIGFIVVGVLSSSPWGWTGALIIILAHGLCSPALFTLAGTTYDITHSRSLFLASGLISVAPGLSIWWFLFCTGNIAAPPFITLTREILLFSAALAKTLALLPPVFLTSFLTAAYNLHLYTTTQHGPTPIYLNTPNLPSLTYTTTFFLHLAPLALIPLKPDLFLI